MAVWDTSVASGLHPNDPLFELASEAALADEPSSSAAPDRSGDRLWLAAPRPACQVRSPRSSWFRELFSTSGCWGAAAELGGGAARRPAASVAAHPTDSPTARSPRARGTKPERRVAWITDIQIAATAWLAGEAVCTADQAHFEALGEAIAKLFPGERKLQVLPPPPQPAGT